MRMKGSRGNPLSQSLQIYPGKSLRGSLLLLASAAPKLQTLGCYSCTVCAVPVVLPVGSNHEFLKIKKLHLEMMQIVLGHIS